MVDVFEAVQEGGVFLQKGVVELENIRVTSVEGSVVGRDVEQKMFESVTKGKVKLRVEFRELRVCVKRCLRVRVTS